MTFEHRENRPEGREKKWETAEDIRFDYLNQLGALENTVKSGVLETLAEPNLMLAAIEMVRDDILSITDKQKFIAMRKKNVSIHSMLMRQLCLEKTEKRAYGKSPMKKRKVYSLCRERTIDENSSNSRSR